MTNKRVYLWDKTTNITTLEVMYSRPKTGVRNTAGHLWAELLWRWVRLQIKTGQR
jgi:hypothetical protein